MKRALLLLVAAPLALLAGCVIAEPVPPPPPPPPARPPPPRPPPPRVISEREAIDIAFDFAHSRGAQVRRVKHARLDEAGQWHVELRGKHGHDRAQLIIDGYSGRVLKARIRDRDRHRDHEPGGY